MEKIKVVCLECGAGAGAGAEAEVSGDSVYGRYAGVQYFCPDKDCEDIFAAKQ